MTSRTTMSTVSFAHPFVIASYSVELPAGDYEVVVDEELLQNLSFVAYHRTATHLLIKGKRGVGSTQMYPVDPQELELALSLDKKRSCKLENSEAALPPLEDFQ